MDGSQPVPCVTYCIDETFPTRAVVIKWPGLIYIKWNGISHKVNQSHGGKMSYKLKQAPQCVCVCVLAAVNLDAGYHI